MLHVAALLVGAGLGIGRVKTPHRGALHDRSGTCGKPGQGNTAKYPELGSCAHMTWPCQSAAGALARIRIRPGCREVSLAVFTPDRLGVDVLFAERADAAMGGFLLRDRSLTMFAADGVDLYVFLAEGT